MITTFVLIVALASGGSYRPPGVITADFTSATACNQALAYWQSVKTNDVKFAGGGCFPK